MLQDVSDESRRMGRKMNIAKTNVMFVDNTPINVNKIMLMENVEGYVYLAAADAAASGGGVQGPFRAERVKKMWGTFSQFG